jgi:hypothetical protein
MWRKLIGLLLAAVVAASIFYGVDKIAFGRPGEPVGTPSPTPMSYRPPAEDRENDESIIDLDEPLPHPLEIEIAGRKIILPTGSVSVSRHVDFAVGMEPKGPKEAWIIRRGSSEVVIDMQTGEIVKWDVAPEDKADFATIREAR